MVYKKKNDNKQAVNTVHEMIGHKWKSLIMKMQTLRHKCTVCVKCKYNVLS